MEIKIIHIKWEDNIKLDFEKNTLYRVSCDEKGLFDKKNNILKINWNNWDDEIFIDHYNNNIYYFCEEIYLNNTDWEDTCYIDSINNIIIRKSDNRKGLLTIYLNEIDVIWEDKENPIKDEIDQIDNYINNYIDTYNDKQSDLQSDLQSNLQSDLQSNPPFKLHNDSRYIKPIVEKIKNIPNIIHFIYGFKEQNEEFELYRYIAIKSAHDVNKPEKIYFYYYYEPYGEWWEKSKKYLTLEKVNLPQEIYGNKLYHYAHQSDVIRLQKLIERGGIYLDIDTICLKSFENLLHYDFVMGEQNNSDNSTIYGLCNAIILSKKNSEFAIKWLDTYRTFRSKGRDNFWDEHSVIKPLELSKIYCDSIKILSCESFFYPLWYDMNNVIFTENYKLEDYKKIIQNNYCIHLWDTYFNKYLKTLTYDSIFKNNTLYNIFSRKFLNNDISIVFLTHNRNEITEKCLNSYLNCLKKDYIKEIIILDNNSNIQLIEYLHRFQEKNNKIKLILSDENLGVCNGRIILFRECKGNIIISIDSDACLTDESFFDKIIDHLYDEKYGIIGISGAYIRSWDFGSQDDIDNNDDNEYIVDHIAGCCQAFRKDLFNFGFGLDPYYDKFWVEDTDLSMQSLELKKINFRISGQKYINHQWGGSGKNFQDLFLKNWIYFANKWKGRVLTHL